jgi:hypothetical protein
MRRLRPDQSGWTTEDRAIYAKWRKIVCICYGSISLLLLAGLGSYAAHSGQTSAMVATMSALAQR